MADQLWFMTRIREEEEECTIPQLNVNSYGASPWSTTLIVKFQTIYLTQKTADYAYAEATWNAMLFGFIATDFVQLCVL